MEDIVDTHKDESHEFREFFIIVEGTNQEIQRRFSMKLSIEELKKRLELLTGIEWNDILLEFERNDTENFDFSDGDKLKKVIGDLNGIINLRVKSKEGLITRSEGDVPKLVMSDEEYSKREDTLRHFKMENKLGRFGNESSSENKFEKMLKMMESINIGDRCEVRIKQTHTRRGTIAYKGTLQNKPGPWIGIKYDLPYGKNDGSLDGIRYFEAGNKYGGFVRPSDVIVGDFPQDHE